MVFISNVNGNLPKHIFQNKIFLCLSISENKKIKTKNLQCCCCRCYLKYNIRWDHITKYFSAGYSHNMAHFCIVLLTLVMSSLATNTKRKPSSHLYTERKWWKRSKISHSYVSRSISPFNFKSDSLYAFHRLHLEVKILIWSEWLCLTYISFYI